MSFFIVLKCHEITPTFVGFSDFVKMNAILTEQLLVLGGRNRITNTEKNTHRQSCPNSLPMPYLSRISFSFGGLLSDPSTDKKHQS